MRQPTPSEMAIIEEGRSWTHTSEEALANALRGVASVLLAPEALDRWARSMTPIHIREWARLVDPAFEVEGVTCWDRVGVLGFLTGFELLEETFQDLFEDALNLLLLASTVDGEASLQRFHEVVVPAMNAEVNARFAYARLLETPEGAPYHHIAWDSFTLREKARARANRYPGTPFGESHRELLEALEAFEAPGRPQTDAVFERARAAMAAAVVTSPPARPPGVEGPRASEVPTLEGLAARLGDWLGMSIDDAARFRAFAAAGGDLTSLAEKAGAGHPDRGFLIDLCPGGQAMIDELAALPAWRRATSKVIRVSMEPSAAPLMVDGLLQRSSSEAYQAFATGLPDAVVERLEAVLAGDVDPRVGRTKPHEAGGPYSDEKWLEVMVGLALDALGVIGTPEARRVLLDHWERDARAGWRARTLLALAAQAPDEPSPAAWEAFVGELPDAPLPTFLRKTPIPEVALVDGTPASPAVVRWMLGVLLAKPAGHLHAFHRPETFPGPLVTLRSLLEPGGRETLAAVVDRAAAKPAHRALGEPAVAWLRAG
ncbi:MAG: hypothetical protein H6734_09915 [Alphaproteobacteria bacterium]|nr:hypothetical protein [Alphaproteobacteria bacterium]